MRRLASPLLLGLGLVLAFVALISVWVREEALDTDRWVQTSTQIVAQPSVQQATAAFLADQLDSGSAATLLRDALPRRVQPLVAPLQAAAVGTAEEVALRLLRTRRFRDLWKTANRVAHTEFLAAIDDEQRSSAVVLDLRPMLGRLALRTGLGIASQFGRGSFLRVIDSDELAQIRGYVKVLRAVAWSAVTLALLALACAVLLSPDRRRTAAGAGVGLLLVGLLVLVVRQIGISAGTDALAGGSGSRQAVRDTLTVATLLLQEMSRAVVAFGALLAVGGWAVGPGWTAVRARRLLRPAFDTLPGAVHGLVAVGVLALVATAALPWSTEPVAVAVYLLLGAGLVEVLRRTNAGAAPG